MEKGDPVTNALLSIILLAAIAGGSAHAAGSDAQPQANSEGLQPPINGSVIDVKDLPLPTAPSITKAEVAAATTSTSSATNVASTKIETIKKSAAVSFYSGVAQVAAGIAQISEYAQKRTEGNKGSENLVAAVTNIGQGQQQISNGKRAQEQANTVIAVENQTKSVGVSQVSSSQKLSFERDKAGSVTNKILDEMEEKSGVTAESLIKAVNENENIYDLASGAKGIKMSGQEIQTLAQAVETKFGKPSDPVLSPGVKMSDAIADINMILGNPKAGGVPVLSEMIEMRTIASGPPGSGEQKNESESRLPTTGDTAEKIAFESANGPPIQRAQKMDLSEGSNNLMDWVPLSAPLGDSPEINLFARIRYHYAKRASVLQGRAKEK